LESTRHRTDQNVSEFPQISTLSLLVEDRRQNFDSQIPRLPQIMPDEQLDIVVVEEEEV
jgi:hypothetical protein